MKKNVVNKTGFTLIELLVVVLIIGILSAIALPGYRKAVERSRVSDALTTMQAVAKSEHGWYLNNNSYTKDFSDLDIDLIDENGNKADGESYDTVNYTFTLQDTSIKAERNNGEYTLYKVYEDPNIYCTPREHYICQQYGWGINKQLCTGINGVWSNMKNTCFKDEQERCAAHEMTYDEDTGTCGCEYIGGGWSVGYCQNQIINEGGKCIGHTWYSCNNSTINAGGECVGAASGCQNTYFTGASCIGTASGSCSKSTYTAGSKCEGTCQDNTFENSTCQAGENGGCTNGNFTNSECSGNGCKESTFTNSTCEGNYWGSCSYSTFEEGGICIANVAGACSRNAYSNYVGNTFKSGSKCIANADADSCAGTFESGSVCEGNAQNSCTGSTVSPNFYSGAKCIANAQGACGGRSIYQPGSCCQNKEGTSFCPANAPKCHCPQNEDGSYPTSC